MKKILSALMIMSILAGLAACGTPPGIAESRQQDTDTLSDSDTASESDTESWLDASSKHKSSDTDTETDISDKDAIPENAYDYAVEMHDKYAELSKNSGFQVSELTVERNKYNDFSIIYGEYKNHCNFIDGEKSFTVDINNEIPATDRKKVIALILQGLADISEDNAVELTQEIANTYTSDSCSDTIEVGEYSVVLFPEITVYSISELICVHNSEMWQEVNSDDYPIVDKKMYDSPELNIGENCKVTGTVVDWYIDEVVTDAYEGVAVIETDDGDKYDCTYMYDHNPIKLDVGARYTIYGSIGRDLNYNGKISIDYPQKLN